MRALVFEWESGTYTHEDVMDSFRNHGIEYRVVSYCFDDMHNDDFFVYRFKKFFEEEQYDFVYSTNYFPLVAKCCHDMGVKYISWSYDNPLSITNIEETLGYPENYVFLFDKIQVKKYKDKGFDNVYHMPLAANTRRLDKIKLSKSDMTRYSSDVSFVGKLYESQLPLFKSLMSDVAKDIIDELVEKQSEIYGNYFVEEVISDEFIDYINNYVKEIDNNTDFAFNKEMLSYAIGTQITRNERLVLLKLLANHYEVKLYSRENNPLLAKAKYMGSCGYMREMPKIFKASKINLNINLRVSQSGMPLRVLDILGSGGFLISSFQPEINEYFVDGRDVVLYRSIPEAYEKASFYLKNDTLRNEIAQNGHEIVKDNFSYDLQIGKILKISGLI